MHLLNRIWLAAILNNVVMTTLLAPIKPIIFPLLIVHEKLLTAIKPSKDFVIFFISRMYVIWKPSTFSR